MQDIAETTITKTDRKDFIMADTLMLKNGRVETLFDFKDFLDLIDDYLGYDARHFLENYMTDFEEDLRYELEYGDEEDEAGAEQEPQDSVDGSAEADNSGSRGSVGRVGSVSSDVGSGSRSNLLAGNQRTTRVLHTIAERAQDVSEALVDESPNLKHILRQLGQIIEAANRLSEEAENDSDGTGDEGNEGNEGDELPFC